MTIAITLGALAYVGLVLFIARFASDKWHPDGGADNNREDPQ